MSRTLFVPATEYVFVTLVACVLNVAPLPKSQNRLVIVPVEVSVKTTWNGTTPFVGDAVKLALGTIAPVPVSELVELPPFALANATLLVNPPAVTGAKRMVTLVLAPPA